MNEISNLEHDRANSRLFKMWHLFSQPHPSIVRIGQRRRAQLLAIISLIPAALFLVVAVLQPGSLASFAAPILIAAAAYGLSRSRYSRAGAYIFSYGITALAFLSLRFGTAPSFDAALMTYAHVAIIGASLLLSLRGFAMLVLLASLAAFTAPLYSRVPIEMEQDFIRTAGTLLSIGLILIGANLFRALTERDRMKQLRDLHRELEDTRTNLEERVQDRTAALDAANQQTARRAVQLQTITELSESIAQLQDLNELLPAVTRLISERFGFYHVGIFLLDGEREFAVLQAANSAGGRRMLERSHRLKLSTGVVGFAAKTGQARIALDVGRDAVYFDNPDLPDTRSEAALPLKSRGVTIGVLDVQSTIAGAFSTEDLQVLNTLANQVAIALENVRLLTETRAALEQVQNVYNEFTRAEWNKLALQTQHPGFRYQGGQIQVLEGTLERPEVAQAIDRSTTAATQGNGSGGNRSAVAVPVKLRGEVIGVLHIEPGRPETRLREDEIRLVEAVAERAALAMENARLFQDARRRAAKERLISEATSRISGALSIENILYATAEELERVLGGSEVVIRFQNSEHE